MKFDKQSLAIVLITLIAGLAFAANAQAANPFSSADNSASGVQMTQNDAQCGAAKCGASGGKSGDDKKCGAGKCGAGKCGSGKGEHMHADEIMKEQCGAGKCGTGKCGGDAKGAHSHQPKGERCGAAKCGGN